MIFINKKDKRLWRIINKSQFIRWRKCDKLQRRIKKLQKTYDKIALESQRFNTIAYELYGRGITSYYGRYEITGPTVRIWSP